ncbi:hypothetical protein AWENTII_002491 [Aspergillus wentii]
MWMTTICTATWDTPRMDMMDMKMIIIMMIPLPNAHDNPPPDTTSTKHRNRLHDQLRVCVTPQRFHLLPPWAMASDILLDLVLHSGHGLLRLALQVGQDLQLLRRLQAPIMNAQI